MLQAGRYQNNEFLSLGIMTTSTVYEIRLAASERRLSMNFERCLVRCRLMLSEDYVVAIYIAAVQYGARACDGNVWWRSQNGKRDLN